METRVTLKNGLRVANFSSPHSFVFDDGSVLEACSSERANRLMLEAKERISKLNIGGVDIEVICLSFNMSSEVWKELVRLDGIEDIDIVLLPLPVLQRCREISCLSGKFYGIRVKDRVTKVIFSDRFCV